MVTLKIKKSLLLWRHKFKQNFSSINEKSTNLRAYLKSGTQASGPWIHHICENRDPGPEILYVWPNTWYPGTLSYVEPEIRGPGTCKWNLEPGTRPLSCRWNTRPWKIISCGTWCPSTVIQMILDLTY